MGGFHFRKGPRKVLLFGVFQPFSDAIKLFSKGSLSTMVSYAYCYEFSPFLGLFLLFVIRGMFPRWGGVMGSRFLGVCFFTILSLGVYFTLLSG